MSRLCGLAALLLATSAVAQESWPYESAVHDCYAAATAANGSDDCIGDAANTCMEQEANGYSTVGMMFCLSDEAGVWDFLLNQEYQLVKKFALERDESDLSNFPEYAVRQEQVLNAQRAWIAFRDANCTMSYGRYGAGSLRQVAGAMCNMRMTAERVLELEQYRAPIQ
ncbi:DUF1311 domain-containing protein [Yoonia sp. F2084L]|uniref:lysozyme inhibitor LprI family protein n=1 Tax=Yoonia sp. F2084L TaxID=2926419 RepID=UPI001FF25E82|nr:lysozyme inhibitor LprI family protein [Yoonia sp. F2084L]MCK0094934.1 DUF1311 domain-containing protein [Yoonia sp. F2084L]